MDRGKSGGPPRIGLLGPYGFGNLGDAAIQDSVIAAIRARQPNAEIHGISLNPADTEARHAVPAHSLYPHAGAQIAANAAPQVMAVPPRRGWRAHAGAMAERLPLLAPPARIARSVLHAADRVGAELAFSVATSRLLRGFDLLVVSGGGQIDDYWGGPWRHPFTLLRWITLARLAGVRVVVLSVGASPLEHRLSRTFARWALRQATYRSFRDQDSRNIARAVGIGLTDPVVPDLAYALPASPSSRRHPSRVVGLSPMAFFDPRSWPERDAGVYGAYLDLLAGLIAWLSGRGYRVELFGTNIHMDGKVVDDLLARGVAGGVARDARVTGVPELVDRLAGCDVLIASRYHPVLLAQVVGTPVLALAHHRKVRQVMHDAGQARYCLDLAGADPARVRESFLRLEQARAAESTRVAAYARGCRNRVERQFDLVFGTPLTATPAADRARTPAPAAR